MKTTLSELGVVLGRCGLRHWRQAWRQQLLLMLILALGTGVYLAMRLANRAALAGFERFADGVTRQPDWWIEARAGGLPLNWLREMREALGTRPVHLLPLVESTVAQAAKADSADVHGTPVWRVLGLDLVALTNLRGMAPGGLESLRGQQNQLAARPGVFVSDGFATVHHVKPGDTLKVVVGDRIAPLLLRGLIPKLPDLPAVPDHVLVMDLPEAMVLLGHKNEVDRVEVLVPESDVYPDLRAEAGRLLGEAAKGRWEVLGYENKRAVSGTMTAAFRLNLTILSLLALFVGGYMIFQSLDGVVLRRRSEIGVLKSLGVRDTTLLLAFLLEAALLGLIGGAVGAVLGWLGAQGAVLAVARTMNALYGATTASRAALEPVEILGAVLLCMITSVIAAWWPARMAAQLPPVQTLGRAGTAVMPGRGARVERWGLGFLLVALLLAQTGAWRGGEGVRWPVGAYAAALAWLLGSGLVGGWLLRTLAVRLKALGGSTVMWRVALSHLRRPSVRHRFAVAALASAVAMASGMAVMVGSFDHTMRDWIFRTMRADVYVASGGSIRAGAMHYLPEATVKEMLAAPEVSDGSALRAVMVTMPGGPMWVQGLEVEFSQRYGLAAWVQEPKAEWWRDPSAAVVNESLTERFGLSVGSSLQLPTPAGNREVRVVGVYADYGNERGCVMLPHEVFEAWYGPGKLWRAALMLKPGADADAVTERMQAAHPGLLVLTQSHLREEALRVFRQTFSVTYALEVIGVAVAVTGLGLALASLLLERLDQLKTLRAIGLADRELSRASALEGLMVAGAGSLAGLVSGIWLGWLLIYRVNKQCFGWTLQFHLPVVQLLALGGAVLLVGALVSAFTGRRVGRLALAGLILWCSAADGRAEPPEGFAIARPGRVFQFPQDHGSHPEFRVEWWYVTGHLEANGGRRFGFQATFFRQAAAPGKEQLYMAHAALLDAASGRFIHEEKLNREGWDAMSEIGRLEVRNGPWSLRMTDAKSEAMQLQFGVRGEAALQLDLHPAKPLVVFGKDGVSRKGASETAASHYLTYPRLVTTGTVRLGKEVLPVHGEAWMDHEFSSSQLDAGQVGWDWAAIQLKDGREVMVYRMRREDGSTDAASTLTVVNVDGTLKVFGAESFTWEVLERWKSPVNNALYPTRVRIRCKDEQWELRPLAANQEQGGETSGLPYWEGACDVLNAQGEVSGRAFLELAGYAGNLSQVLR